MTNEPAAGSEAGRESELTRAITDLQVALHAASTAAGEVARLIPRIGELAGVFDRLEADIRTGRERLGAIEPKRPVAEAPAPFTPTAPSTPATAVDTPTTYARPTLVPPASQQPAITLPPEAHGPAVLPRNIIPSPPSASGLACFKIEFESTPGPLDLRAIDDAVGEEPAVRDVALLDYAGNRATLKVWIDGSASAPDVQRSLAERASAISSPDTHIRVVALDDVA